MGQVTNILGVFIDCCRNSFAILIDPSTVNLVHVLMLFIQAIYMVFLSYVYTGHCSLYNLFFQAIPLFSHDVTIVYVSFLASTKSNHSRVVPAVLRTHSFVFFVVQETRRILLSPFASKASRHFSSFFRSVQLS